MLSVKMFLHKAKIAKSALGFFAAYRDFMLSGEIAPLVSPIVMAVDAGEVMPTPALTEVIRVVFEYNLAEEIRRGEEKMARESNKVEKPYLATIYSGSGEIAVRRVEKGEKKLLLDDDGNVVGSVEKKEGIEELVARFENHQRAQEWCDRRLVEGASDCWGEVVAGRLLTKSGVPMTTVISRADAIARVLRKGKSPVIQAKKMTTSTLGFGVKAKQDSVKFSRG